MDKPTMLAAVRSRIAETTTADYWTDAEINGWLDEGLARFAHEADWPWLMTVQGGVSLPSGTATLELQSDVNFDRHFFVTLITGSTRIIPQKVEPYEGVHLATYRTTSGTPEWYYLTSGAVGTTTLKPLIQFVPTPNATYTVEYTYLREPTFRASNNIPDIPVPYHNAIVAYATHMAWLKESGPDAQKAQEQFMLYRLIVNQALTDMQGIDNEPTVTEVAPDA